MNNLTLNEWTESLDHYMMKTTSIPLLPSVVIFGSKSYGLTLKEPYLGQPPPGLITEA